MGPSGGGQARPERDLAAEIPYSNTLRYGRLKSPATGNNTPNSIIEDHCIIRPTVLSSTRSSALIDSSSRAIHSTFIGEIGT